MPVFGFLDVTDKVFDSNNNLIGFTLPDATDSIQQMLEASHDNERNGGAALVIINGCTFACHNGKLHELAMVDTGRTYKVRGTNVDAPVRKWGFRKLDAGRYPFTHGRIYLLHPNAAVTYTDSAAFLNMGRLWSEQVEVTMNENLLLIYYDVQWNCAWRAYTEDECARKVADSQRSQWYITQLGMNGKFHENGHVWNDFGLDGGRTPCDIGIRVKR